MDIGGFTQGGKTAKDKGKGKGKGDGARKDSAQCWECFGYGHYGRECPHRADKGKGKDKGKHKGKSPEKGWPKGGKKEGGKKGKGKGGGKLNALEESWSADAGWCAEGSWTADGNWWTDQGWQDDAWQADEKGAHAEEGPSDLGGLDLCAVGCDLPFVVKHGGKDWLKVNLDSGAAATALPLELAEGMALQQQGELTVASGSAIPNMGRIQLTTMDEQNICRRIKGNVTSVKKPLLSAGEASKNYDTYLFDDGGMMIPKRANAANWIRRQLRDSCA
eukprot:2898371-Amphidinium_carterae.1